MAVATAFDRPRRGAAARARRRAAAVADPATLAIARALLAPAPVEASRAPLAIPPEQEPLALEHLTFPGQASPDDVAEGDRRPWQIEESVRELAAHLRDAERRQAQDERAVLLDALATISEDLVRGKGEQRAADWLAIAEYSALDEAAGYRSALRQHYASEEAYGPVVTVAVRTVAGNRLWRGRLSALHRSFPDAYTRDLAHAAGVAMASMPPLAMELRAPDGAARPRFGVREVVAGEGRRVSSWKKPVGMPVGR